MDEAALLYALQRKQISTKRVKIDLEAALYAVLDPSQLQLRLEVRLPLRLPSSKIPRAIIFGDDSCTFQINKISPSLVHAQLGW